jgi:hypothetical protein
MLLETSLGMHLGTIWELDENSFGTWGKDQIIPVEIQIIVPLSFL